MSSRDEVLWWWLMQRHGLHGSKGNNVVLNWHPQKWLHSRKWCFVDVHGFWWVQVCGSFLSDLFSFLQDRAKFDYCVDLFKGVFGLSIFYGFGYFHSWFVDPVRWGDCWCLDDVVIKLYLVRYAFCYCLCQHWYVASVMFHGGADIPCIGGMEIPVFYCLRFVVYHLYKFRIPLLNL